MRTTCRVCRAPVIAKSAGRPPSFCSIACRRMAERDIRRLDADIGEMQREARWLRNPARMPLRTDAAEAAFLVAEIAQARKRLRELLGDA